MGLGMIGIGRPSGGVYFGLIAPRCPVFHWATGKKFNVRAGAASLYDFVLFVWFSGMFSFHSSDYVDLTSAGIKSSDVFTANAKQNKLSCVAEIKTYSSSVRPSILADFVPDQIGFVLEAPSLQNLNSFKQKRIGNPQIQVSGISANTLDGKGANVGKGHGAVSVKSFVFWSNFAGFILELPWRVCQYGLKALYSSFFKEVF